MPEYKYTAKDENGKTKRGVIEVSDETRLQQYVSRQNLYLIDCSEVKKKQVKQLKATILAEFSRQVGTLVGAGIPLVRALTIVSEEEGLKPIIKNIYVDILKEVKRGTSLSVAMEMQGRAFPSLMINMYRSSESSGRLASTAMKMAEHYEKEQRLNSKVKSSTVYPKFLGGMIVVVLIIIMGFVMPQFKGMFDQMEKMPVATEVLFAISDFVANNIVLTVVIIFAVVIILKIVFEQKAVKLWKDKILIHLPGIGKLMKVIYTARFARTLSSLYSCGISIVNALQISKNVIGNTYIESQFDELIRNVRAGQTLSESLAGVDGFSKKLISSVMVGEESGTLEGILNNMADTLEYESEMSLNKLVAYLEPCMLVIMAGIVMFIMLGVIMPIYDSYGAINTSTEMPTY